MRRAAKVDANQRTIIAALEAAGATVEILGQPLDLLVGAAGKWMLMEVKANAYEAIRPSDTRKRQIAFAERHPHGGPIETVWDVAGALRALAALRNT